MSMNVTAPANLIGVDQQFFYMIYYGFLIAIAAIIIMGLAWGIFWFMRTSPNVRRLRKAIRKGRGVLTVSFDNGSDMIVGVDEVGAEGAIKVKGKKEDYVFFHPRAFFDQTEGVDNRQVISMLTKGQTIDGVPHVVAYAGKAIATNIKTVAALEYAENDFVAVGQAGTNVLANGGTPEVIAPPKKGRFEFHKSHLTLFFALWPVALKSLKASFDRSWNQAQIRAYGKDEYIAGMLRGRKNFHGLKEWMPVVVILGLALAVVALVVIYLVAK